MNRNMDYNYDENLSDNNFFIQLQKDHAILLETAPLEDWIICVPRAGCIQNYDIQDPEFLLAHILISHDELPETHFTNLIGKNIKLVDKKLFVINSNSGWDMESKILFEEIFYTKDLLKYKIWCVDTPLFINHEEVKPFSNYNNNTKQETTNLYSIQSLSDSINVIISETKSKYVIRKLENLTSNFIEHYKLSKLKNNNYFNMDELKIRVNKFIANCIDIIKTNRNINSKIKIDPHFLYNVEIATGTVILNLLYEFLFNEISTIYVEETQYFNKIIKNLSDLNISHFQINYEFYNKIPNIKIELSLIDSYTTVIDKLNCLKKIFNTISNSSFPSDINTNNNNITVDDVLPILVFGIIKSGVFHWITNLIFLKEFYFNTNTNNKYNLGPDDFLIATLEAAIIFINSNNIKTIDYNLNKNDNLRIKQIFSKIIENNENEVINFFKRRSNFFKTLELCHPLCDCKSCLIIIKENLVSPEIADINGMTSLHLAAKLGLPKIVNLLIEFNANINSIDDRNFTPLHYCALTGQQNTLLLLLHAGANINSENNEKNTSLHLATLNGHGTCVKAMLYYSDHMKIKLNINSQNNTGNTALHIAAKIGFITIVESFVEYGARVDLKNKLGLTAIDVAHNTKIKEMLEKDGSSLKNNHKPITPENSIKYGSNKSISKKNIIDKIIQAISDADTNLALYYLGFDSNYIYTRNSQSCHPLCNCKICKDFSSTVRNPNSINLNSSNALGLTPLHAAAYYSNVEVIKILIKNNADPEIKSKFGQTPLHLACQNENFMAVSTLLEETNGKIVNIVDDLGNTSLHTATQSGNLKLVETLLKFSPNVMIKNQRGETPATIAERELKLNILGLLTK